MSVLGNVACGQSNSCSGIAANIYCQIAGQDGCHGRGSIHRRNLAPACSAISWTMQTNGPCMQKVPSSETRRRTAVCSATTPVSDEGDRPSIVRMVGASCAAHR